MATRIERANCMFALLTAPGWGGCEELRYDMIRADCAQLDAEFFGGAR